MKSLLRRLPRSKSKSRRSENTTSATAGGGAGSSETQNNKLDDLRVPKIETADLKVGPQSTPEWCTLIGRDQSRLLVGRQLSYSQNKSNAIQTQQKANK